MSTENIYTDITETGAQTGKELSNEIDKSFNNPEQPKITLEQARAMRMAQSSNILPQKTYSSIYQQSGGKDYFGSSMFDDDVVIGTSAVNNLGDIRAENQPWYAQLGAGVAKGVALAGTTFMDGTVGLVVGAGTAIAEGRISGLWDNAISNAMSEINEELEEILPNYRTQAEMERPWYQNMGTMNFWADGFIKNVGFTVGALYSGKAWLGALKALNLVKGATAAKGIGTFMSAFNEGRIEANHVNREILENEVYKINNEKDKIALEILESDYDDFTKESMLQELDNNTSIAIKDAEERAASAGLTTLIGNTALLTASNLIQFGKLYSRGFENANNLSKNAIRQGKRYVWEDITKKQAVGKGMINSLTEGFEEMNQAFISETAGYWNMPDSPDSYYKALQDPDARVQTNNLLSALALGMTNSYGDGSRWEEFAIGALTGFLGVPTFGKVQNSDANTYLGRGKSIGLSGGLFGEISQANSMNREGRESVDIINKYLSKLDDKIGYFAQNQSFTNAMDGWASTDNKFEFTNASNNDDFAAISAFARLGKLQDFKDMISQDFENLDEAALKDIAMNTTPNTDIDSDENVVTSNQDGSPKQGGWRNVDGTLMSSTPEGREEMKKELVKKRDKILQEVDKYEKAVRQVRAIGNDSLDESRVEELAWLLWKQEIFKDRYKSIKDSQLEPIQTLLRRVKSFISIENTPEKEPEEKEKLRKSRYEQLVENAPKPERTLDLSTKEGQTIIKNLTAVQAYLEALLNNSDDIMSMANIVENNPEYLEYMSKDAYGNTILEDLSGLNPVDFKNMITDLADMGKIANAAKTFQERFKEFVENPIAQIKNRNKIKSKVNQVIQERKNKKTKEVSDAIAKRINFDSSAVDIAESIQENMSDIEAVGGLDAWLKTLSKEQRDKIKTSLKISKGVGAIKDAVISEFKEDEREAKIALKVINQAAAIANSIEEIEKKAYEILNTNLIEEEMPVVDETGEEALVKASKIKDTLKEVFDKEFDRVKETITAIEKAEKAKEATLEKQAKAATKSQTVSDPSVPTMKDGEPEEIATGEEIQLLDIPEGELLEIKGAIKIGSLQESTKKENDKISVGLLAPNKKEYNRPQISELYFNGYGETYLDFIKNNANYIPEGVDKEAFMKYIETIYSYLKKANAFNNIKGLKKGATLKFFVDLELNEQAGTFIVLIKDNEGNIVGSMPSEIDFNSKSKYIKDGTIVTSKETLAERNPQRFQLFNYIKEQYDKSTEHSTNTIYFTTKVGQMMGGTLPKIKENRTVAQIEADMPSSRAIVIGVTNKEGSIDTGNTNTNKKFIDSGYTFNKIEGQVYVGVYSPATEKYLPALVYSTPISDLINNKDDWYIKETIKVIQNAAQALKTPNMSNIQGLAIKSWLNFPSLGVKLGRRVKGNKWVENITEPTHLVINITNRVGQKYNIPIALENGKITEENAYKAIQSILKKAGDITTNIIINRLQDQGYIDNISNYLYTNMSKLESVNDWFTYEYDPNKAQEGVNKIKEETDKQLSKTSDNIDDTSVSINGKTYIIKGSFITDELGTRIVGTELEQVKFYLNNKERVNPKTEEIKKAEDTTEHSKIENQKIGTPIPSGFGNSKKQIKEGQSEIKEQPSKTPSNKPNIRKFLKETDTSDAITTRDSILQDTETLKKMFPTLSKEGRIRVVDGLIKTVDEKGNPITAYGMFKDGILYISNKSPKGTAYHEAFHYITDMLLTDEEKQMMFQEAELQYSSNDKMELEENLAEAFRNYMNGMLDPSLKGTLRRLFAKIKHIINGILGKEIYLDNLFYKIYRGRLAYRPENKSTSNAKYLTADAAREMLEIEKKTKANGTFMKAPNGNPTNLNEMQWLQVRTKAFKEWFGDWENHPENASKVVDENGEPLVVYHGSANNDFYKFDRMMIGSSTDEGYYGRGFYFSEDERTANKYGLTRKFFLNIKNPFEINPDKLGWEEATRRAEIAPYFNTEDGAIQYEELSKYDGVIQAAFENNKVFNMSEIVVPNPNQIKSATDNEGIFSTKDNNIYDSFKEDLLDYRYKKTDYSNLDNETKQYLEERHISEQEYQSLSASQREYLLHCM